MQRRRGRPPADPTCGVPNEHLQRKPMGVLESDDARFEVLAGFVAPHPYARAIERWPSLTEASRALADVRAYGGLCVAHAMRGGSSHPLLAEVRAQAPKLPIFVTVSSPDPRVNARCRASEMWYVPGPLNDAVVGAMLDAMEGHETAALPLLAYVVRRGHAFCRGDEKLRLKPHEAMFAVAELERAPRWDLTQGAARSDRSAHQVRSRTLRKVRARSFDWLRRELHLSRALWGEEKDPS